MCAHFSTEHVYVVKNDVSQNFDDFQHFLLLFNAIFQKHGVSLINLDICEEGGALTTTYDSRLGGTKTKLSSSWAELEKFSEKNDKKIDNNTKYFNKPVGNPQKRRHLKS